MGIETNAELIRALEEQIAEGNGAAIELKRTRNSLLNISTRVPPEILGNIFVWAAAQERDLPFSATCFEGLKRGSYSFVLVCHHWFKVASDTPELWTFWGNTLGDWNERYHHAGAAPVDLVLDGYATSGEVLSIPLRNELKDRAARDGIRQIHIRGDDTDCLGPVLSALTPDEEGVRRNCIKSIILQTATIPEELSDFLARSRLPQLQHLNIAGTLKSPFWDHVTSQTTHLVTLSLEFTRSSLPPTTSTSQLISILASNPHLQHLTLWRASLPGDTDGSGVRVPLRHLRTISLAGEFRCVFRLMQRLELPDAMESTILTTDDATVEDIYQTLVPHMRDFFRRDTRFKDRLGVDASFSPGVRIFVNLDHPLETILPRELPSPTAGFSASIIDQPPDPVMKKLCLDLMALIPQEHVATMTMGCTLDVPEELFFAMPNIEHLRIYGATLSDGFLLPNPNGPHANAKLLPSLRSLRLEDVITTDWKSLKTYLAHQTSDGQTISLQVFNEFSYISPEDMKEIQDMVEKFTWCVYGLDWDDPYVE